MKKYMVKMLIILIAIFFIILSNKLNVYAATSPIENPDYYNPNSAVDDSGEAVKKASVILNVIQVAGIVISVVTLMVIGIKYMFSGIEERADYKKTMIPWVIGALMVATVTTIPKIINTLAGNI